MMARQIARQFYGLGEPIAWSMEAAQAAKMAVH
jgi:hypothetical protein